MSDEKYIELNNVCKSFNDKETVLNVLDNISFTINKGEFICIVGGSGCGKSTLLRIIAGLDTEYEGNVVIENNNVTEPSKNVGIVFQEARLFPWLSTAENVKFALDNGSNEEKAEKTQKYLKLVGLEGFEKCIPKQLSGGMAQRANIARALVNTPEIMLLDEPFGALDAFTKIQLQNELLNIKRAEGTTMVLVTHDIDEAVYLADRVVVMSSRPGTVREIVNIDLPRPRDRNGNDFLRVRKRIFNYFFETVEITEEYNI